MKEKCLVLLLALWSVAAGAQEVPFSCKWLGNKDIVFSYDGSYADTACFKLTVDARMRVLRTDGVKAPEKYSAFPLEPADAVNLSYSPDSTMLAFTRNNDLWVADISSGKERRLTFDGSATILNGYASWVYYEEILGRPSKYKAFWWSPDGKKLAFYRFDDSQVPMFPIYSPFGQDGVLRETQGSGTRRSASALPISATAALYGPVSTRLRTSISAFPSGAPTVRPSTWPVNRASSARWTSMP